MSDDASEVFLVQKVKNRWVLQRNKFQIKPKSNWFQTKSTESNGIKLIPTKSTESSEIKIVYTNCFLLIRFVFHSHMLRTPLWLRIKRNQVESKILLGIKRNQNRIKRNQMESKLFPNFWKQRPCVITCFCCIII